MIQIKLVRATAGDANDYARIGTRTTSRFNRVTTDLAEAAREIEESTTYMLELDKQRVGFISYTMEDHSHAYIAEVQVDPDFQGRGIGGFALRAVLEELEGMEIVDLHTHPENPAQKLYGRHGFRRTGEVIQNYHGTGEPRMRMVFAPSRT